jgi:2'-5' RNA ligase
LIRSFLAIELPKSIQKKIEDVQTDLKISQADVKWVHPENIHLTLKFFGNIEESRVEPILQAIGGPIQATSPFSVKVQGMGAFPHSKNPRVIWVGLIDGKGILTTFQKELEGTLVRIGFEPEGRPFQPHLTVGRVRTSRGKNDLIGKMEKHRDEEFGCIEAEEVVLFRSELKPTGPIYTPLRKLRLGLGR